MANFIEICVVLFVVHADGDVLSGQFLSLVEDQLSAKHVDDVQQLVSHLLSEGFAVVEAQSAQLLLEFQWPPESGVNHRPEDGASACLIDAQLVLHFLYVLFCVDFGVFLQEGCSFLARFQNHSNCNYRSE